MKVHVGTMLDIALPVTIAGAVGVAAHAPESRTGRAAISAGGTGILAAGGVLLLKLGGPANRMLAATTGVAALGSAAFGVQRWVATRPHDPRVQLPRIDDGPAVEFEDDTDLAAAVELLRGSKTGREVLAAAEHTGATVEVLSNREWDELYEDHDFAAGVYRPWDNVIHLREDDRSPERIAHVLAHELVHAIDHRAEDGEPDRLQREMRAYRIQEAVARELGIACATDLSCDPLTLAPRSEAEVLDELEEHPHYGSLDD